jgi:signal transduction histidine kinase/ActR/RegA family two-component response regulator
MFRTGDKLPHATLYLVGGATYPIWYAISPENSRGNSFWAWLAVGLSFVATGLVIARSRRTNASRWLLYAPAFLAAAHLQTLATLNRSESFFAVASVMMVLSAVPMIRDRAVLAAYTGFVVACCALQLWQGAGATAFLAVGTAWMTLLFGGWVRSRAKTEARLHRANAALAHERSERQRLEHELATAQRMDSLGRLAGAFSHEFNNQLMAIRLHADLLARSLPANAPQRRDVAQIQQTTGSAADLTARLLAFSGPNRTREAPAELCAALRQSLVTLRHLMSEQTEVSVSAPELAVVAPVGAKQLGQILLNLALNARDAMPNGGSLRIEIARIARSSIELPIAMPTEMLARLSVTDSGAGMSADVRDHLFEPFFTTKSGSGNSGLGLSVVYGHVKETGGHIRVTSEPGRGARFDIYWPLATPTAAASPDAAAHAQPGHMRARVLLVEDQAALRDGLTRWLADQGYAVIACESAEEALTRAADVDVIASDVVLRGMDGIELLGNLRRAAPALPAVLFSGHLDPLALRRREVPPGVEFLEKPFAPEALLSTLEALVARARSRHPAPAG